MYWAGQRNVRETPVSRHAALTSPNSLTRPEDVEVMGRRRPVETSQQQTGRLVLP
jgi:hypothetical protein